MERIPLSQSGYTGCPSCGNNRTLGFLYVCRQEHDINYLESIAGCYEDGQLDSSKSLLRQELERIGLSESIVASAEQGHYTDEQLKRLKAQKLELTSVIAENMQRMWRITAGNNTAANSRGPSNNDGACGSTAIEEPLPTCNGIACHACCPFFNDRISVSFDAVFESKVRPFHPLEASYLPVKSSLIMRSINTHPPYPLPPTQPTPYGPPYPPTAPPSTASQSSLLTYKTTQSELDGNLHSTRRRFYALGRRSSAELGRDLARLPRFGRHAQALRDTLKTVFHASGRESSSDGSTITLPMERTAAVRDEAVEEFDIGALRRVRRQKERLDAKCGAYEGGFEGVCGRAARRSVDGSRGSEDDAASQSSSEMGSLYSYVSEGSEVEVEGGVALTEEAVETGTPDIVSGGGGEDAGLDLRKESTVPTVGLDSIMAQV